MSTDHLFHPLNMEQWIMLMSIQRAKDAFRKHHHHRNTTTAGSTNHHQHNHDDDSYWLVFDEIQVVCAILESELDTLLVREILSSSCDRIVSLSKSTATEYGLKKALPFLQELYTSSTTGQEDDDSYYWMITNADICVTPNIYIVMEQELRERQAMALSINRMTIDFDPAAASASLVPKITRNRNDKGSDTAVDVRVVVETLLDDLLRKTKDFQNHPGYDCFVIHESVLRMIHFGEMFIGYPPWGSNVHLALTIMAKNYVNIKSNRNGTFHLGNDRSWQKDGAPENKKKKIPDDPKFWNDKVKELEYLPWCPISNHPPPNVYALQNSINCGKWFRPAAQHGWTMKNRWWGSNGKNNNNIPFFVQESGRHIYEQRSDSILKLTPDEGMPLVVGQPTPQSKQRVPVSTSFLSRWATYLSSSLRGK